MSQVPKGWVRVDVEAILAPLEDGRTIHQGWSPRCDKEPSDSEGTWGVLKTTAIQPGAFLPEHNKRLPDNLSPRPLLEVQRGDLLITCAGPRARCGVACLVRDTRPRLMLSGKMYRFRLDDRFVDPRYVEAYLLNDSSLLAIDGMKTGTSDSGLNLTHGRFRKLQLPLAPRAEQERIVAAIEEQFSRLDAAEASLRRAQRGLTRLRSASLVAGFDGEWPVALLGSIVEIVRGVTYNKAQARSQPADGYVPILRATNIQDALLLDRELVYVPEEVVLPGQRLRVGDIVVASSSGSSSVVGKSRILEQQWVGAFGAFCAVLRVEPAVDPRYVAHVVASPPVRKRWSALASGTNINNLKREHLSETPVPLPPLEEQRRIVAEVERQLSLIDTLAAATESALHRSAALRRAILARAFAGELVPQDPSDEPASALLERIAAQRASENPARRGKVRA